MPESLSLRQQHWTRRPLFINLLSLFEPGKVVDLGAGHGGFSIHAADLGWEVTAVDARTERWKKDERITWVQQDVREHDLSGYDLICCLGLFYHLTVEDQLDFLRRAAGRPSSSTRTSTTAPTSTTCPTGLWRAMATRVATTGSQGP